MHLPQTRQLPPFLRGFTGLISDVVNEYFTNYFPAAVATATSLVARNGTERLIYTTHSWLVSLYLDCPASGGFNISCPDEAALGLFRKCISDGWITWHAFPFNAEPEAYDSSLFAFGVNMSHWLDDQFKKPRSITMSQRDVPGMTRSVIPLLLQQGVLAISEGVNSYSAPPVVPTIFNWSDAAGGSLIYMVRVLVLER